MKKVLALVLALVMMSCLSVTAFAADGSTTITLTVPEHGGHTHTWGTEYSYDENGHWYTCSGCFEKKDYEAHDFSVPQHDGTQHWNKCAKCDATDTKADHTESGWLHDSEYHWKDCTVVGCGTIVASKSPHEFGTDKVCDICGYEKTVTIVPLLLEGNNGKFVKGGKDGLSFRSSAEFADFIRASVDGHVLDSDKYTVKSGSTIVTLKADYLETLSAGSHTLTITSTTGSVDADFTIEAEPATDDPSSPTTGDASNMFLWIALMFVSGIALVGIIVFGKKKKSVR